MWIGCLSAVMYCKHFACVICVLVFYLLPAAHTKGSMYIGHEFDLCVWLYEYVPGSQCFNKIIFLGRPRITWLRYEYTVLRII